MAVTEESMNTQLAALKAGQDALEAGQRALAELIKEECGKHFHVCRNFGFAYIRLSKKHETFIYCYIM